jgi:hypothetical protein
MVPSAPGIAMDDCTYVLRWGGGREPTPTLLSSTCWHTVCGARTAGEKLQFTRRQVWHTVCWVATFAAVAVPVMAAHAV